MKYIMLEAENGAKLPIIFPDCFVHSFVAGAIQQAVLAQFGDAREKQFNERQLDAKLADARAGCAGAPPVSAGFISLGTNIVVHGSSESLGDLKHNSADAVRIVLGDSVQFMPDNMVALMAGKLLRETE